MFNLDDEDEPDSSHEYCNDDCDCFEDDEAYLDQVAARNFEDEEASRKAECRANNENLLEYNLQGVKIPIKMLKTSEEVKVTQGEQAEMEAESPFPATVVETVVTDPIMTTSLTSQTIVSASSEAAAVFKKHMKHKKSSRKTEKVELTGCRSSGTTTPRVRPPPSTPQEHDAFPHTLSTPHLPVFHHYTDQLLLEQYQVERAKDPVAFDLQTSNIKRYLLDAKIERGGVRHLEESEYSVDLASREDAAKVQLMAVQRRRGMTETDLARSVSLEQPILMPQRPPKFSEQPVDPAPARDAHLRSDDAPNSKGKGNGAGGSRKRSSVDRKLPKDFDFANHVAKYTTSGSMRHQHQRTVLEDDSGTKTILKTWIEITQEIVVPAAGQLGWEDVKLAVKDAKAAKKEAKRTSMIPKQDGGSDDDDDDIEAKDTTGGNDPADLLGAIARIKGTGKLSRGVSLSQYLDVIKKDVKQALEDNSRKTAESGDAKADDPGKVDSNE